MLQESAGLLHFILKGIATKRIKEQQTQENEGNDRRLSKAMTKGPEAVTPFVSAIFCLDLGHQKEFLAERGINGAIFAVHQFLRLKFGQKRIVLCQSIIIHHQSSTSSILKHPQALPSGPMH